MKKTVYIFFISAFFLLNCQTNEKNNIELSASLTEVNLNVHRAREFLETKSVINIQLSEKKNLKLIRHEGVTYLQGSLEIIIQNASDMEADLVDMGEHSLVFINIEDSSKTYVPLHECRAVAFFMHRQFSYIHTSPEKQQTMILNTWSCDGGPFDRPPSGKYMAFFRTFERSYFKKSRQYYLNEKFIPYTNVREITKKAGDVLHSKEYWEGAVCSDTIFVEL